MRKRGKIVLRIAAVTVVQRRDAKLSATARGVLWYLTPGEVDGPYSWEVLAAVHSIWERG